MKMHILKAISDETRMRILKIIGKKEICACKLPLKVKKTQPAVSQHLKVLLGVGLINLRKDGTKRMYSISLKGKKVLSDILKW